MCWPLRAIPAALGSNLEIDILQENAKLEPNAAGIANLNAQVTEINNQVAALDAELEIVSA